MVKTDPLKKPCFICGGSHYAWGEVVAPGLRFVPDRDSWLKATFGGGRAIRSRRCETCGNVQMFDQEEE